MGRFTTICCPGWPSKVLLANIWQNPKMSYAQKIEILNSIFKNPEAPMQKEVNNFLRLLVGKGSYLFFRKLQFYLKNIETNMKKLCLQKLHRHLL